MKKFVQNIVIVMVLTIAILFSYAYINDKTNGGSLAEFVRFLMNSSGGSSKNESDNSGKDAGSRAEEYDYKAVWLSYLEFNSYVKSVKNNNAKTFTSFYKSVLKRARSLGFNRIIVQVRPFGDALYSSKYFPWAACISGSQGKNPGYDPLAIMTELTHKEGMKIEAWINPYRISSGAEIRQLSEDNPAKKWASSKSTAGNVLEYEQALYYNPSSDDVRKLIINGIKEIVNNYDVDGIHMDDYFYPEFTEDNVDQAFDATDYRTGQKSGTISRNITLADWRRKNVNLLVSDVYKTIKSVGKKSGREITFGISPAGNLSNLRSNLGYYTDIDTWVKEDGYVDYLMPQIYWGFTNEQAPFDKTVNEWTNLMKDSDVTLYIGLQLYRMGSTETGQSDEKELQNASLIRKELDYLNKTEKVSGYCFFSYQYLDCSNKKYHFDTEEFSKSRKKILKKIVKKLRKSA